MSALRKRILIITLLANIGIVCVSVLYVFFFFDEDAMIGETVCRFKQTLFMYCPGCGGTRSVYYLLHLDFVNSFIACPAVPLGALIILDLDVRAALCLIRDSLTPIKRFKPIVFVAIPVALLVYFVIRNVLLLGFRIDLLGDFLH